MRTRLCKFKDCKQIARWIINRRKIINAGVGIKLGIKLCDGHALTSCNLKENKQKIIKSIVDREIHKFKDILIYPRYPRC